MKKRIWALLLICILFIFDCTGVVYAVESNNELSYATERVSHFLGKTGYLPTASIMLSNPIKLNTLEQDNTQNLYFIFDGEKIIGQIIVSNVNGTYYSTFSYTVYSELQYAYEQEKEVILLSTEGCLLAQIDGMTYVLENVENKDISLPARQRYIFDSNVINKVAHIEVQINTRSIYYHLKVPFVGNTESPQGKGLCWAACMASKIMYQTSYSNLTAMTVYDKCWESVENNPDDIPIGTERWYKNAASLYGISLITYNSLVSESIASNALANGKPMILDINRSGGAHAVVLCGLDEDASYMEFILMDPNVSSYVYVSLPNNIFSSPSQFYYASSYGYTYTRVSGTRY